MNLTKIIKIIHPYRQFLVAFSGGLDSTVMLHILMSLRNSIMHNITLRAIHIHHGLSINADNWVKHCQLICTEWNIPLVLEHIIIRNNKLGIEGQARKERYKIFKKTLLPNEVLVIAHHLDDQSETFLLALKRGSGPAGLSAMPVKAVFSNTYILRPLLNETRASLLNWANIHNLFWIEDESNQDVKYDRNFLRLHVLPTLNQRWRHFAKAVTRSAMLCAEQESLLDEFLINELTMLTKDNGALAIKPLIFMSTQHRSALLRRWLSIHGALMPSRTTLNRIWREVAQARKDSSPCLHLNGYLVRRFHEHLWWVKKYPSLRELVIKWPNIHNELMLPHGIGSVVLNAPGNIRLPLTNEIVSIRFKVIGMLHIVGRNGKRKLKKIWQEYGIPPWLRGVIPLLFYNENVIASADGLFITQDGWIESGFQLEWNNNIYCKKDYLK